MPSSSAAARVVRFDNFELDIRAGELRKHGVPLRLQGQPLHVLAALLERAGDVVTREELRAQVWAADTFVDFDHSLHNAIARLREVLGDCAETPRYVETLPRRGYRFIAPVEPGDVPAHSPAAKPAPPTELSAHSRLMTLRTRALSAVIVVLVSGIAVRLVRTGGAPTTNAALRLNSVAVLPLDNLSGDPSQDYFVDGMTEQLITDLAQVGSLRVIGEGTIRKYNVNAIGSV